METLKVNTRFMQGNKTDEIFDILSNEYGMGVVCSSKIDWCESIFSNGFILAVESGMIPILGTEKISDYKNRNGKEFHHFIFNDECYIIYFE